MRLPPLIPALLALAGLASPAEAVDLTKIERRIAREPAYQSKAPRYCLVVFGPEAKTRVWLVLDGDTLYVDRNGNGDLTEEGEKVALPPFKEQGDGSMLQGERDVKAGPITAGPVRCELMLRQAQLRKGYKPRAPEEEEILKWMGSAADGVLTAVLILEGGKGADKNQPDPSSAQVALGDHRGMLQFASRSQEAPVIHFDGPLSMTLQPMQKLVRGRESELKSGVGTPGLGQGTFVTIMYQGRIPDQAHPVADIEFPPAGPGKAPIKTRVTLNQRC
ncbi:MAG: hypothetical protein L0Z62_04770 [Gemmataceae bacterium]|nr:hypothetical protein [Gemmataceae bacterium]